MSFYSVDMASVGGDMLPPDKRQPRLLAFVKSLMVPVQYILNLFLESYKSGNPSSTWSGGPYSKGERVKYNFAIYESLIDANTDTPTNTLSWRQVQANFIGVEERVVYSGQKIMLEYALNKWFGTAFVQPNGVSDIYITTNAVAPHPFIVGGIADSSSNSYANNSTEVIIDSYTFSGNYRMTINIPIAVYTSLSTVTATRDLVVRSFVDKYTPAGIPYNIVTF